MHDSPQIILSQAQLWMGKLVCGLQYDTVWSLRTFACSPTV